MNEPQNRETSGEETRVPQSAYGDGQSAAGHAGESRAYIDYLSTDVLLSLQHPRSQVHDELTFHVSGQVMELLFKLSANEIEAAQAHLDADRFAAAIKLIRRVGTILESLRGLWPVLDTLTPNDFNGFRDYLGTSSGFQSYMYRTLEFRLGNKNLEMLRPYMDVPDVYAALNDVFEAASLWESVNMALKRHGYDIDRSYFERDPSVSYDNDPSVEAAWLSIYRRGNAEDVFFQLGETLMEVADAFSQWRMKHLLTVERIIGSKIGTGGTTGAPWLRTVANHRFFPELWAMRTQLP